MSTCVNPAIPANHPSPASPTNSHSSWSDEEDFNLTPFSTNSKSTSTSTSTSTSISTSTSTSTSTSLVTALSEMQELMRLDVLQEHQKILVHEQQDYLVHEQQYYVEAIRKLKSETDSTEKEHECITNVDRPENVVDVCPFSLFVNGCKHPMECGHSIHVVLPRRLAAPKGASPCYYCRRSICALHKLCKGTIDAEMLKSCKLCRYILGATRENTSFWHLTPDAFVYIAQGFELVLDESALSVLEHPPQINTDNVPTSSSSASADDETNSN